MTLLQQRQWCRCKKAAYGAALWLTYTCHLSDSEDAAQQEHLDRDGEDEDKGKGQRRLSRHNSPKNS